MTPRIQIVGRLPVDLNRRVRAAAKRQQVSLNTFLMEKPAATRARRHLSAPHLAVHAPRRRHHAAPFGGSSSSSGGARYASRSGAGGSLGAVCSASAPTSSTPRGAAFTAPSVSSLASASAPIASSSACSFGVTLIAAVSDEQRLPLLRVASRRGQRLT